MFYKYSCFSTCLLYGGRINERHKTVYKNPHGINNKRTALKEVNFWEPVIRYTIVNYNLCKKQKIYNKATLPLKINIFNGDPFECTLFVGGKKAPTPKESNIDLAYRISFIATNVDILLVIVKSNYFGEWMQLGESTQKVFSRNNFIWKK